MTINVGQALLAIPDLRARVDSDDDYLREVIRKVEDALGDLRPVPLDLPYEVEGAARQIQLRQSRGTRWHVAWRGDACDSIALLSAPREARVEAFTPVRWPNYDVPIAPLEALVIGVMQELARVVVNRGPSVEVAQRLLGAIDDWATRRSGGRGHAAVRRT